MPRHCKRFGYLAALTVTLSGVLPKAAHAYDDQAQLDLSVGYLGVPNAETLDTHAAVLDVGGGYGLNDMFMLRAAVGGIAFVLPGHIVTAGRARIEALYILDVLQVVPFLGLGGGAWLYESNGISVAPSGHGTLGVDYLLNRTWTLGLDVRLGVVLFPDEVASFTEGQLRVSRVFDLF